MSDRRTDLRRDVQHIIAEELEGSLESGAFADLSEEAEIYGHTEEAIKAEIIRQIEIMRRRSTGG